MNDREYELARHVAATADAWLTDPRDGGLYQRLVDAVLAWRSYAMPTLDGLQDAGRPTTADLAAASEASSTTAADPAVPDADDPGRQPAQLGALASDLLTALRERSTSGPHEAGGPGPST